MLRPIQPRFPDNAQEIGASAANTSEKQKSFTTVFDINYADRALAMMLSLLRHAPQSRIYALCCDRISVELFRGLGDPRIIALEVEDELGDQYAELRDSRTHTELMWTLSSFSFDLVFNAFPDENVISYVDADIFFLEDPSFVIDLFESSESGALITPHYFSASLTHLREKFGTFNVQFIPMKRKEGLPIRARWKSQCAQWCFARHEDGKFGDQKYLNDWPTEWGNLVMVWDKEDTFLGPWNIESPRIKSGTTFHFSSFEVLNKHRVRLAKPGYRLPKEIVRSIYLPYLNELRVSRSLLRRVGYSGKKLAKTHYWYFSKSNQMWFA